MDEELISKKELLQLTGISYGQLYRWKRKSLIPEEWFIKKSAFTGQETFFPRDKILERIDKIKDMKEDVPLDELANILSGSESNIVLSIEEMLNKNIVTQQTVTLYNNFHDNANEELSFQELISIYIMEKLLQSGDVGIEEIKLLLKTIEDNYNNLQQKNFDVILIRKYGIAICSLISENSEIYLEKEANLVYRTNLNKCSEEIKTRLL